MISLICGLFCSIHQLLRASFFPHSTLVSCGRVLIILILFVMSMVSNEGKEGAGDLPKVIWRGLYPPASKASKIPTSLLYQNTTSIPQKVFSQFIQTAILKKTICLTHSSLFHSRLYLCISHSNNKDNKNVCCVMNKHTKRSDAKAM